MVFMSRTMVKKKSVGISPLSSLELQPPFWAIVLDSPKISELLFYGCEIPKSPVEGCGKHPSYL